MLLLVDAEAKPFVGSALWVDREGLRRRNPSFPHVTLGTLLRMSFENDSLPA